TRGRLSAQSQQRFETALALFTTHVDVAELMGVLGVTGSPRVTPLMFEQALLERAAEQPRHIVLPEGEEDRVLRAAATVLSRGIAELTIIGEPFEVRLRAIELGVDIRDAQVLSSFDPVHVDKFAREYAALREHKGVTFAQASDIVTDAAYFGTLMV